VGVILQAKGVKKPLKALEVPVEVQKIKKTLEAPGGIVGRN